MTSADVRRGGAPLDGAHRPRRRACPRAFCVMATGCLSDRAGAAVPGPRELHGQALSHRELAARGRGLHRPAGGRHRHGLVRDPVHPHHREAGRAPLRVPAHAQLLACRPRTCRWTRSISARWKAELPQAPAEARESRVGFVVERNDDARRWPSRPRRGEREYEKRWQRGGLGLRGDLPRHPDQPGRQRHRRRVLPREDPRHRARSRAGRAAHAARRIRSAPSGSASTPTTTRPSTATTSPWWTCARRPSRRSRPTACARRRAATRSTASSSPPASTP